MVGVPLVARQAMPAFHKVLQQGSHLRLQAHVSLHHRFPERWQDGVGLWRLWQAFTGTVASP